MDIGLYIVFFLEIILVNMLIVHLASKRRYGSLYTHLVLGAYTLILILFMHLLLGDSFIQDYHNGAFLLVGFLYLLPFKYLYKQPLKYTFAITCTTWLYTLFLFSLSVRIATILNLEAFERSIIITHTLLYCISLPLFIGTLNKATFALRKIKDETLLVFIISGSLWFIAVIILNILFEGYGSNWLELLVTLLLLLCTVLSYKALYSLLALSTTAKELTRRTKTDALTGLKNREAFLLDAQKRIASQNPFAIIFMDLDNFKKVNDRYGHAAGDQYLIHFANFMSKYYDSKGTLYRLSGDEFVFLFLGEDIDQFCSQLEAKILSTYKGRIRFQGLSMGYSSYPKDGDNLNNLLQIADHNMYQHKKVKHMLRT